MCRINPEPLDPILLSIKEVAAILRINRSTVYELLDKGFFESRYIGRRRLVLKSSVDEFVARLPETPPQG